MGQALGNIAEERPGLGVDLLGEQPDIVRQSNAFVHQSAGGSSWPVYPNFHHPEGAGHKGAFLGLHPRVAVEERSASKFVGYRVDGAGEPLPPVEAGAPSQEDGSIEIVGPGVERVRALRLGPAVSLNPVLRGSNGSRSPTVPHHDQGSARLPPAGPPGRGRPSSRSWRWCSARVAELPNSRIPIVPASQHRSARLARSWPVSGSRTCPSRNIATDRVEEVAVGAELGLAGCRVARTAPAGCPGSPECRARLSSSLSLPSNV